MFVAEGGLAATKEDQGSRSSSRAGQPAEQDDQGHGSRARPGLKQPIGPTILNWRPEMGPRTPTARIRQPPAAAPGMAYCLPFIRPPKIAIHPAQVLVGFGKTAVDGLLGADRSSPMGGARAAGIRYADRPTARESLPSVPTCCARRAHQARRPKRSRRAWEGHGSPVKMETGPDCSSLGDSGITSCEHATRLPSWPLPDPATDRSRTARAPTDLF